MPLTLLPENTENRLGLIFLTVHLILTYDGNLGYDLSLRNVRNVVFFTAGSC
jgi:hypothetical protein